MRRRVSSDGIGNDHPAALLITNDMESEEANAGPEGCQIAGKVKWLSASSRCAVACWKTPLEEGEGSLEARLDWLKEWALAVW